LAGLELVCFVAGVEENTQNGTLYVHCAAHSFRLVFLDFISPWGICSMNIGRAGFVLLVFNPIGMESLYDERWNARWN
jgi:hypothetical protein